MKEKDNQSPVPDNEAIVNTAPMVLDALASHGSLDHIYQETSDDDIYSIASEALNEMPDLLKPQSRRKIARFLEVWRIPRIFNHNHYFSEALDECFKNYYAECFIACSMMTHALNEGILKFLVECHGIKRLESDTWIETIDGLVYRTILSCDAAQASKEIYRSHRNDIHHMNPQIADIDDWHGFAKTSLRNLATVEACVFGYKIVEHVVHFDYPQHWKFLKRSPDQLPVNGL